MKKIQFIKALITAGACFFFFTAKAQLSGTKWQGTIKIPVQGGPLRPFQTVWDFHGDTLTIIYTVGTIPADVMSYTEEKNIVSVRKISGGVPCDNNQFGLFSYEIKDDQLLIKKIEDACQVRGASDVSQPFTRVKQP